MESTRQNGEKENVMNKGIFVGRLTTDPEIRFLGIRSK